MSQDLFKRVLYVYSFIFFNSILFHVWKQFIKSKYILNKAMIIVSLGNSWRSIAKA